jgi:hypothetical protein
MAPEVTGTPGATEMTGATGASPPAADRRDGWLRSWLRFDPDGRGGAGPEGQGDGGGDGGPGGGARVPGWQRVLGGLLVAVGAVELAVVESFLVPLRAGTVPLPVSVLLAVVGNVALTRLMWRACRHRGAAAAPVVAWLVVVLVLAARRQEGDLVVPGTATGLAFLLLGTVAGAFALGQVVVPAPRPRSRP